MASIFLTRKTLFLFLIFLFIQSIYSSNLDFRIAGFIPTSKLFREVYNPINPMYQIEFSGKIKKHLQAWTNFSYLNSSGKSIPLKIKSRLELIPVSLGFKYLYYLNNCLDVYAGLGICYSWLKEKNNLTFFNKAHNFGAILKFGIEKKYKYINFSFFVDYLFQNFKVHNQMDCQKVNSSGLILGAGIGIIF